MKYNTRYATYKAAQADGWRRIDRFADRDVSGIGYGGATMFGYKFESQDGQTSTTSSDGFHCNWCGLDANGHEK